MPYCVVFVCRTHENILPYTELLHELSTNTSFEPEVEESQKYLFVADYCIQLINHSDMTHPIYEATYIYVK